MRLVLWPPLSIAQRGNFLGVEGTGGTLGKPWGEGKKRPSGSRESGKTNIRKRRQGEAGDL